MNIATDLTSPAHLATIGGRLEKAVACAGLSLIECLIADHPAGIILGEQMGIDAVHFRDDLEIIFLVVQIAREASLERMKRLIRIGLQRHHFWNPAEIVGNYGAVGCWSDVTLDHLFNAMYPSRCFTEHYARRLLELCDIHRRLSSGLEDADRVLWPQSKPSVSAAPRQRVNVGAA